MILPETLSEMEISVSCDDIVRYANLSGDHNPIHVDDGAAQAAGFPRAIAHGMFTMAASLKILAAHGIDMDGITSCFARFGNPLLLPGVLCVQGRLIRDSVYEIEAFSQETEQRVARLEITCG